MSDPEALFAGDKLFLSLSSCSLILSVLWLIMVGLYIIGYSGAVTKLGKVLLGEGHAGLNLNCCRAAAVMAGLYQYGAVGVG